MQIALSDLKSNIEKYVELANTEDVIITRFGKPAAKIIRYEKEPQHQKKFPEKITSIDNLFGTIPVDLNLGDLRLERLRK